MGDVTLTFVDLWLFSPFFTFTSLDSLFELEFADEPPATLVFGVDLDIKLIVLFSGEMLPFELSVDCCVDGDEVDESVTSDDTLLAE